MRVISGYLGGRHFDAPTGHRTHPMSEKARGGLFNTLGDLSGLSVLDGYGGSGALSFEAISRGAASAVIVEVDISAYQMIKKNSLALDVSRLVKAIRANISIWSENNKSHMFDVVLADPPYDQVKLPQLQKLAGHVKLGGIMVLSLPGKSPVPELDTLELIKERNYGDAQLAFYRRIS